jgi:hypothetical protein
MDIGDYCAETLDGLSHARPQQGNRLSSQVSCRLLDLGAERFGAQPAPKSLRVDLRLLGCLPDARGSDDGVHGPELAWSQ